MALHSLPLSQIAISSIDLCRSEVWWREGLGFLPSTGTRLFRGKKISGVVGLANSAATTRWLVGQDEWLQIELWQYESPMPRIQPIDYAPNYVGFSRCGVWVKEFDSTMERLATMGTVPLGSSIGEIGERRICVRNPDGIYVEIFEADPMKGNVPEGLFKSNAAFRSITITTEDLEASVRFAIEGLGLEKTEMSLHCNEHESLWGFDCVVCSRQTFASTSMLVEYVSYQEPATRPRHPHSRLNDQGILNVAFGDNRSAIGVETMYTQASKVGAVPGNWIRSPIGGCVYMTDPLGISYEFMWAKPGIGHKLTGYLPSKKTSYPLAENHRIENSIWIDADADSVFSLLVDHEKMARWMPVQKTELINPGFNQDGGFGSVRLVECSLFKITEQVTHSIPGRSLRYRILSGGPFSIYMGEIELRETEGRTHVSWANRFRAKIPGTGLLLNFILRLTFKRVLLDLKNAIEQSRPGSCQI